MPENLPPHIKKFDPLYYKHAIWKAWSGAMLVLLGSAPTVVLGWDTMLISGKVVACIGLAIAVIKSLDLFFDQTLARLAAGKTPVQVINGQQQSSDTTIIKKTENYEKLPSSSIHS